MKNMHSMSNVNIEKQNPVAVFRYMNTYKY